MKKILLALFFTIFPYTSKAATANIRSAITAVHAHSTYSNGGCMILLAESPTDHGLDCVNFNRPSKWVSLGCVSDHIDPDGAQRMLDAARDSVLFTNLLDAPVPMIRVVDHIKHNGYCTAITINAFYPRPSRTTSMASSSSLNEFDSPEVQPGTDFDFSEEGTIE
ncbi:MAG: hypothetical protein OXK80_01445 [Bdellovibrionales bacterium]|nr:hypothetical protein [Bdellovibrionales bacterium]